MYLLVVNQTAENDGKRTLEEPLDVQITNLTKH